MIMSAGSCFRGYFFGLQETLVPAINQVLEQVVRMTVIFLLAGIMMPLGLAYACAAAVIGIVAEEVFSLIYILASYKKFKVKNILNKKPTMNPIVSLSILFAMAMPLTANRVTGSLLTTFENMLIPQRLQLYGMTAKEAISAFGQLTGMALPIIYFPSAFLISLSISLVPSISEASTVKNFSRVQFAASRSILFSSIIGFCAASLFVVFSNELGQIIYKQDISHMLMFLGVMSPFLYMQVVLSGILNGLGYQVFLFRNSLISSAITIAFVYFLIPKMGIDAFILGWFVSLVLVCYLEIEKLRSNVHLEFEFSKWFFKPLLAAAATSLVMKFVAVNFLLPFFGNGLGLLISVVILSVVYMSLIILLGCLTTKEIADLIKSIKPKNADSSKNKSFML